MDWCIELLFGIQTLGHKFHVHEHPTAGFDGSEVDNCRSNFTRGHFNPLSVDLQVSSQQMILLSAESVTEGLPDGLFYRV